MLDFTEEQKDEFWEAFLNFCDEDGEIAKPELGDLMEALGEEVSAAELDEIFKEVDEDGSGMVDFDEFIEMMRKRLLGAYDNATDVRSAFELLDKDGSGKVSRDEIENVVVHFCGKLTEDEVTVIMSAADINHDGELDYEEFSLMMQQMSTEERMKQEWLAEGVKTGPAAAPPDPRLL